MAAMSLALTAKARRPSPAGRSQERRKCTPSTSASVVSNSRRSPTRTTAQSSPTPTSTSRRETTRPVKRLMSPNSPRSEKRRRSVRKPILRPPGIPRGCILRVGRHRHHRGIANRRRRRLAFQLAHSSPFDLEDKQAFLDASVGRDDRLRRRAAARKRSVQFGENISAIFGASREDVAEQHRRIVAVGFERPRSGMVRIAIGVDERSDFGPKAVDEEAVDEYAPFDRRSGRKQFLRSVPAAGTEQLYAVKIDERQIGNEHWQPLGGVRKKHTVDPRRLV